MDGPRVLFMRILFLFLLIMMGPYLTKALTSEVLFIYTVSYAVGDYDFLGGPLHFLFSVFFPKTYLGLMFAWKLVMSLKVKDALISKDKKRKIVRKNSLMVRKFETFLRFVGKFMGSAIIKGPTGILLKSKTIDVLASIRDFPFINSLFYYDLEFVTDKLPEEPVRTYESVKNEESLLPFLKRADRFSRGLKLNGILMVVGMMLLLWGFYPIFAGSIILAIFIIKTATVTENPLDTYVRDRTEFTGVEGLYRINCSFFLWSFRVGVAFAKGGTVHSRLHVTGTTPLYLEGDKVPVSYVGEGSDTITWGGRPRWVTPSDGEAIQVVLLHPDQDSIYVYNTYTASTESGDFLFAGAQTLGGTSGSPFFAMREGEKVFAGVVGSNYAEQKEGFLKIGSTRVSIEFYKKPEEVDIWMPEVKDVEPGGSYQIVDYPGSGKTRLTCPRLIRQGLVFCENIVVAAPTRAVAHELFRALEPLFETSLNIKGSSQQRSRAKVVVTTHPALLAMLLKGRGGDPIVRATTGYIIDESHFSNSATKCLLAVLRDKIPMSGRVGTPAGFLAEMSATCMDLSHQGMGNTLLNANSNFPIMEVGYTNFNDCVDQVTEANRHKRIVIFCASVRSTSHPGYSIDYVAKQLMSKKRGKIFTLFRHNFDRMYPAILAHEGPAVIVTTNISECGVNLNADIVIDCCKALTFREVASGFITGALTSLSEEQMVQRRGRVGRRKEGSYYYMHGTNLNALDSETAEDVDRDYFSTMLNLNRYDPKQRIRGDVVLSPAQIIRWMAVCDENSKSYHNVRTVDLFIAPNGSERSKVEQISRMENILRTGEKVVKFGKKEVKMAWWDERDREHLAPLVSACRAEIATEPKTDRTVTQAPILTVNSLEFALMRSKEYIDHDPHGAVMVGSNLFDLNPIAPAGVRRQGRMWGLFKEDLVPIQLSQVEEEGLDH